MLQLAELQPEHELPVPAIAAVSPTLFLEKEAKRDKRRLEGLLQRLQAIFSSALPIGSSFSKLDLHFGQ